MADEVYTIGWGRRLGESIKRVLVGILLFLVSFPVLFWNEGRAVREMKGLKEAAKAVTTVPSDALSSANEGKLIHTTGTASSEEDLVDPAFASVKAERAIRLARKAEIYQWKEKKEEKRERQTGGSERVTVTYRYEKLWTEAEISSSNFHRDSEEYRRLQPINSGTLQHPSKTWTAQKVKLGAFLLPGSLVDKLKSERLDPPEFPTGMPEAERPKRDNGAYYFGADPSDPRIGDVRIGWEVVKAQPASVLGQQAKDTLVPYTTSQGTQVLRLDPGTVSAATMIESAKSESRMITWILRVVGFFLMFIGLTMVVGPFAVLMDVLPFLGDVVRIGTGLGAAILSICLSLSTISIAWLFYRPLIGIPMLAGGVGLLILAMVVGKKKKAPAPG